MKTDDPKLTAYALDELAPAERAEIEALLHDDTALAAEIEATRNFAARLRRELHAEEGAPLSAEQRGEVLAIVERPAALANVVTMRVWPRRLLKIAAVLVLSALLARFIVFRVALEKETNGRVLNSIAVAERERFELNPASAITANLSPEQLQREREMRELEEKTSRMAATVQPGIAGTNGDAAIASTPVPDLEGFAIDPAKVRFSKDPPSGTPAPVKIGTVDMKKVFESYSKTKDADPKTVVEAVNKIVDAKVKAGGYDLVFDKSAPSMNGVPVETSPRDARDFTNEIIADPRGAAAVLDAEATAQPARKAGKKLELAASPAKPAASTPEQQILQRMLKRRSAEQPEAGGITATTITKSGSGSLVLDGTNSYRGTTVVNGGTLALGDATKGGTGLDSRIVATPDEADRLYVVSHLGRTERGGNTEAYDAITDNAFLAVKDQPLSTFSIDVDTASYANVRRFLTQGARPPKGAVRIEEMLNYFPYDYPQPAGDAPFSATMEVAACPWTPEHRLVRIGLKGRDVARSERGAANLVFLIDVSGSMQPANKLPLVKESLRLLVDQLDDRDQVAIAVYAGASGTVLEPTRDKAAMRAALGRLEAGGSTNGAGGIQLAYRLAEKSFLKGGTNRVILATDGDFNVGVTSQSDLVDLITAKAKSGVFLTVLGFGMGNLKDSTLEKLADKGNGNYGYIDTLAEAKKTLVEQMNGTLFTIAKDVKIQVEFNPAQVGAYRLIGYENRVLAKEDFNDDKKDAGEIGAGHSVTALYEVVPPGGALPGATPGVDELKYSGKPGSAPAAQKAEIGNLKSEILPELLTLKLRYKKPDGDVSTKLEFPLTDRGETWEKSSQDFRWAAAVASFGMLLRDSPHKGRATWDSTLELAHEGKGEDPAGYRAECVALIEKARGASGTK